MPTIIQDKLDGAAGVIGAHPGNIVGRTMDSGHVWHPGFNGKGMRLDGTGAATGNYPENSEWSDVWCATQMPTADYWVELDVEIPTNDDDSWFDIYYKIQEQPNAVYGAESSAFAIAQWFPVLNSTQKGEVYIGGYGNLNGPLAIKVMSGQTFGVHTMRVTVVGVLVSVYVDGVFILSSNITGAIPNNGWVGFGMNSRNLDGSLTSFVRALEFRAGTFGPGDPFWTGNVRTYEVWT